MFKIRTILVMLFILFLIGCDDDTTSPDKSLNAPLNLTLNQLGFESIKLTWQDNSEHDTGFLVDRKIGEGEWETDYRILADTVSTIIDSNLVEIGNYAYRIYATKEDDQSDFIEASLVFSYDEVVWISVSGDEEIILHPLESRALQFTLLDAVNTPVERDYQVCFTLLQAPEGVSINGVIMNETDSLFLTSEAGLVNINLTAGSEEGIVTLKAWVKNSVGDEIHTFVDLELDYQYPEVAEIVLLNEEQIIMNTSESREIFLTLKDESGNLVQDDYEVWFKILSAPGSTNINETLYDTNDSLSVWSANGVAAINLEAGHSVGEVNLKAYTFNSTHEEISCQIFATIVNQYPDVAQIVLINEDPIVFTYLNPVEIGVSLRDEFGDYVQEEYEVFFQFIDCPTGTSINQYLYEIGDSHPVMTVNGFASVSLWAGYECGNVGIKIFTYNSQGEEISVTKTNILVITDVPHYFDLSVGGVDEGEDLGNGQWRINLVGHLYDDYGYPILDGCVVHWSLFESPAGVSIENELTQVGNGDNPEPGATYNFLTYDGSLTNDSVEIRIEIGEIGFSYDVILPIQFPIMDIVMVPVQPDWDWEDGIETISPRIILRDGQNNLINNQTLIFESTLGMLVDMESDEDDDAYTEVTGYNDVFDSNGMLIKEWQFNIDECPPPQGDEPGTISGELKISVLGTDLDQVFPITLYRYPEQ